jgi:hypothetical protein
MDPHLLLGMVTGRHRKVLNLSNSSMGTKMNPKCSQGSASRPSLVASSTPAVCSTMAQSISGVHAVTTSTFPRTADSRRKPSASTHPRWSLRTVSSNRRMEEAFLPARCRPMTMTSRLSQLSLTLEWVSSSLLRSPSEAMSILGA